MPSVDNRIVSMTFDNQRFENKLQDTIDSLNKLGDSIDDLANHQPFDDINTAANRFDVGNMADAIDSISNKFSALGAIAFTAIQNITNGILGFVGHIADIGKQDVLAPILTGGKQRAMNIEQAKFMFAGLGLDVQKGMDSAKAAVLGTAYGLDAAAKVASQFGASGIKVGDQMTSALRGVAGAAAMTGSSFSEIGDIFAQSAASGKVRTIDLEQFSTRGLNAAAAIAKVMGKTEAQVREMASNGTLDFATFAGAMDKAFGSHATEANKTYAGSLANLHAAMSRMGEAFLAPRLTQERDIFNALTPDIDKMTAAMKPLFQVFTDFGDVTSKHLIATLNHVDFKKITEGFKIISFGVKDLIETFNNIKDAIKSAFKDVFPPSTLGAFTSFALVFHKLAENLKPTAEVLKVIRDVFHVLFETIKVGFDIVKGLFGVLEHLGAIFKTLTASSIGANGGILGLIDKLALLIIKVEDFLTKGGGLERFFAKVNIIIDVVVVKIQQFIDKVKDMSESVEKKLAGPTKAVDDFAKKVNEFFFGNSPLGKNDRDHSGVTEASNRIQQRLDQVSSGFDKFVNFFKNAADKLKAPLDKAWNIFANWMNDFKEKIVNAFKPGDFDSSVDAINVGLLTALTVMFRRFMKGGLNISFDSGIFKKIKESFDQLTGTLKAMQTEIKAEAIEKIAISVAIMAASLLVLSLIDSKKLTQALLAVTVSMSELGLMLKVLDDIGKGAGGTVKLVALSGTMIAISTSALILAGALAILAALDPFKLAGALAAMVGMLAALVGTLKAISGDNKDMLIPANMLILIAGAMVILSGAIAILAALDPLRLAGALAGLTAALALMVGTLKALSGDTKDLIVSTQALNLIAISMVILAGAIAILASIDPIKLASGLLGLTTALSLMVGTLKVMSGETKDIIASAFALNLIATSMIILSKAIELIGSMDWKTLDQGLLGVAAALAIIAATTLLMPPDLPAIGLGLVLVALAVNGIAIALRLMSDTKHMGQALESMGLALLILAAGAMAMEGALPGAIALGVMAVALGILTIVLEQLAKIKTGDIIKALIAMAGIIGILAGMSILLSSALAPMIGLAVGLGAIGLAFVALGYGMFMLGKGLEAIAKFGLVGFDVLAKGFHVLFRSVIAELKNEIEDLLNAVPLLIRLVDAILSQLLDTLIKLTPKLAKLLIELFKNGLKALREIYPDLIQTGLFLLLKLLEGIANNIDPIVTAAINILVNFLQALSDNVGLLIQAGVNLIISFLSGVSSAEDQIMTAVIQIMLNFVQTIVNNIQIIIDAGANMLIQLIFGITRDILKIADAITQIIQEFIIQIGIHAVDIATTGTNVLIWFLGALTGDVIRIANAITDMIIALVTALGNDGGKIAAAGAGALAKFLKGLGGDANIIGQAISGLIHDIVTAIVNVLNNIPDELQRLANGFIDFFNKLADVIRKVGKPLGDAMANLANAMIQGFGDAFVEGITKVVIDRLPGPLKHFAGAVTDFFKGSPVERGIIYKIGQRVMVGFGDAITQGFANSADSVTDGSKAIVSSMSDALAKTSDILGNTAEFNPTITPVLDLTRVQTEAGKINDMMVAKISPDASLVNANDISAQQAAINASNAAAINQQGSPSSLEFNQTINAPQPLSANDIYRNTKSQIVLAKKELGIDETN